MGVNPFHVQIYGGGDGGGGDGGDGEGHLLATHECSLIKSH